MKSTIEIGNSMNRLKRLSPILLVLVGVSIILYPGLRSIIFDTRQKYILNEWYSQLKSLEPNVKAVEKELSGYSKSITNNSHRTHVQPSRYESDELQQEHDNYSLGQEQQVQGTYNPPDKQQQDEQDKLMLDEKEEYYAATQLQKKMQDIGCDVEGLLIIEKIELEVPIIKGATEGNLNISVSSVEHTGKPGEEGNYCIAGHKSRIYGKHFSRLHELEEGDAIQVYDGRKLYKYTVYNKFRVKAEDVWVLEHDGNGRIITLITCDYSTKPKGRLIVKGSMKVVNTTGSK